MRARRVTTLLLTSILLVGAAASHAANLLTNPNFDNGSQLTGWIGTTQSFNANDADGNPNSGSNQVRSTSAGAPNTNYCNPSTQCVGGVTAGSAYHLAGKIFLPAGADPGGSASLTILWFQGANCTNQIPNIFGNAIAPATGPQDQWVSLDTGAAVAPAGAVSAEIFLNTCTPGPNGTVLDARYDDLLFDLAPLALVPTLDPFGLIALGSLLAAAALYVQRRRSAAPRA